MIEIESNEQVETYFLKYKNICIKLKLTNDNEVANQRTNLYDNKNTTQHV